MKKIYKTLLAAAAVLSGLSATAQVNAYSFTQFAGTFNAATGGTVIGSTSDDDLWYVDATAPLGGYNYTGAGFPLGFNFVFNGNTFDRLALNTNGWIAFGQSSSTPAVDITTGGSQYNGISAACTTPALKQHRVAGFSRDLQGQTGSSIRIETQGSAPSRTTIVQWQGFRRFAATVGTESITFQIRLMETTNIIQVVYGSYTVTAANTAEVGIRGNSNADYLNRNVTSPNIWSTSIAGTANTDKVNFSSTLIPNNGQVYEWDPPPPCNGTPSANTVLSSYSMVCPNGFTNLSLQNSYTNTGISYQWQSATSSSVGPFTAITNATATALSSTSITIPTYYRIVVTCANSPISYTSSAVTVQVAGTTTNSVPYFEGFEGLVNNNDLPNCSWAMSNTVTCQTYVTANTQNRVPRTGDKFASFYYSPGGTNYFYTNGVQLNAGVTYSASMWYTTEYYGYNTFNLEMLIGTSQSTTGLVSVASKTYAASPNYKQLNNTFTVPTSGIYYMAIKGQSNGNCCGYYLSWDDLSITVPCNLNTPTLAIGANSGTICAGQPVNLTASGADTYTWTNGPSTATYTDYPTANITYMATGTNSITNCTASATKFIKVNPSPDVAAIATNTNVCEGSSVNLIALGASSYTWNVAGGPVTGNMVTITPTTSGMFTYSVNGSNSFNCGGSAVVVVNVNPMPNVSGINGTAVSCAGDNVTLIGTGANSYQWVASNLYVQGTPINVSPAITTNYTLTGTDLNGCAKTVVVTQSVAVCTGLKEYSSLNGLNVYPNPANASFNVDLKNGLVKTVELMDVTGRKIASYTSANDNISINIADLANGIYYAKVKCDNAAEVVKIVKQ